MVIKIRTVHLSSCNLQKPSIEQQDKCFTLLIVVFVLFLLYVIEVFGLNLCRSQ